MPARTQRRRCHVNVSVGLEVYPSFILQLVPEFVQRSCARTRRGRFARTVQKRACSSGVRV